jgi:hypothetical protein
LFPLPAPDVYDFRVRNDALRLTEQQRHVPSIYLASTGCAHDCGW